MASLRFKKDGTPYVDFRAHGKRYRPEFLTTKDARKFLALADADPIEAHRFWEESQREQSVKVAAAGGIVRSLKAEIANFKDGYCAKRANARDMRRVMDEMLAHVLKRKACDDCDVSDVELSDLETFQAAMCARGITNASVNRYFTTVKTFFKRMQRAGYVAVNYAPLVEGLTVTRKQREHVWGDGDTPKLVDSLTAQSRAQVLLDVAKSMEFTPFGPTDFKRLKWSMLDFDFGFVRTFRMKGKGEREWDVPITLGYHKLLLEIKNRQLALGLWKKNGFVYLTDDGKQIKPGWVSKSLERARKSAGIEAVPYTSRHRVITKVNDAVDLKTASKFAGHASTKTTEQHYVVSRDEEFGSKVKEVFAE